MEIVCVNPTERSGVTRWWVLPIWVYLLKNQPVKQKDARLTLAHLSTKPMPWDMLLFKKDGKFSQIWGSLWGPSTLHQCPVQEPCLPEIALHPATEEPSRDPYFLNFLKMFMAQRSLKLAKSSSLWMFEHPVGLSVQNPAEWEGDEVNLFAYRWRSPALKELHTVGSAMSGGTEVLAAGDKMPPRESGTIPMVE